MTPTRRNLVASVLLSLALGFGVGACSDSPTTGPGAPPSGKSALSVADTIHGGGSSSTTSDTCTEGEVRVNGAVVEVCRGGTWGSGGG